MIFKLLYRVYRVYSRLHYSLPRRFTPPGLGLLVGLVFLSLTAVDTENTVAYQGATLLLCLLTCAIASSLFFRAGFSASRRLPRFGTAGQPFNYWIRIRNLSRKRQADLLVMENLKDPRPTLAEWKAVHVADEKRLLASLFKPIARSHPFRTARVGTGSLPAMSPLHEAETSIEITPLRRGLLQFTGLTVARPDPLGLVRAFATVPLPQTMLILPKRYPLPPVALPGATKYQEGGVAFASNVGQSEEFVSLRDYRRGDPLRHIHWRSWARTGRPIVKEFEDEFFVRHALILDTFSADPRSDVFEEAVSIAASFACTILTQESLLDLLFIGPQAYCFTAGRGLAHSDQMLEILASVRACLEKPFDSLDHLVMNHVAQVSGCICVFIQWDEPRQAMVRKLKSLGVPLLVLVVVDSNLDTLPLEAGPMADALDRFHVLELGAIERGLARLA